MKRKAIFLISSEIKSISTIYPYDVIKLIKSMVDLYEIFIDRDNLNKNEGYLKESEVAFSTWGMPNFTEEEIKMYMPKLKVVFYAAGSVQNFARPFLNSGIKVVSAWEANAKPVAEYAVAQIILANKGFYQNAAKTKMNCNDECRYIQSFPGNYDVKVGILGVGMIGTKVIEMLKPYDIEILVFDPYLSDENAIRLGVKKCSLYDVFSGCQTISNHLANNAQTVGILNREHFNLMSRNATFINTGCGAQVVESDLIEALKDEPARTAVLDVTYPEPPGSGSELLTLENVFLTSHIAGSISNEQSRLSRYMIEEYMRYEKGEELRYGVTLEMLKTMA